LPLLKFQPSYDLKHVPPMRHKRPSKKPVFAQAVKGSRLRHHSMHWENFTNSPIKRF